MKFLIKQFVNRALGAFDLKVYSTRAFGRELCLDIKRIVPEPKIMFDVGANVGQTVELWSGEFPHSLVHSFEPVERLYLELAKHESSNVVCNHLGLGEEERIMRINYGKHDVSHSFFHPSEGRGGEETRVTTLDRYCENNNIDSIDILKLDVEGFEKHVIEGGVKMLNAGKVSLIVAELGFEDGGYYTNFDEFHSIMKQYDFVPLGFYDQTSDWNGDAKLLFTNVLFARKGLSFVN